MAALVARAKISRPRASDESGIAHRSAEKVLFAEKGA